MGEDARSEARGQGDPLLHPAVWRASCWPAGVLGGTWIFIIVLLEVGREEVKIVYMDYIGVKFPYSLLTASKL